MSKILFTDIFRHFHKNIKLTWSHSVINEERVLIFCTLLYEICNFGYNGIINQSEVITRHCDLNNFDSFNFFIFGSHLRQREVTMKIRTFDSVVKVRRAKIASHWMFVAFSSDRVNRSFFTASFRVWSLFKDSLNLYHIYFYRFRILNSMVRAHREGRRKSESEMADFLPICSYSDLSEPFHIEL